MIEISAPRESEDIRDAAPLDRPGVILQRLLRGTWRRDPPHVEVTRAELEAVMPLVTAWSLDAMLWHRLRSQSLSQPWISAILRPRAQAWALRISMQDARIVAMADALDEARVPFLVFKGRALSSLYPEPYMRPSGGDVDFLVPPQSIPIAEAALRGHGTTDLVHMFAQRSGISFQQMAERSRTERFEGREVPVLGPEHHLLALCENLLRHGAQPVLALLDVSAALEASAGTFEWEVCLLNPRHQRWVGTAAALAAEILDARIDHLPLPSNRTRLREWMPASTVGSWCDIGAVYTPKPGKIHAADVLRWRQWPGFLRERWPLPIAAAYELGILRIAYSPRAASALYFALRAARFGNRAARRNL